MIYLSCPSSSFQFGRSFADAIGYSAIYEPSLLRKYFPSLSILPSSERVKLPMPEFEASLSKFLSEVKKYEKSTGRIPILFIDNVNYFCRDDVGKTFLLRLQRLAKEWAVYFFHLSKMC